MSLIFCYCIPVDHTRYIIGRFSIAKIIRSQIDICSFTSSITFRRLFIHWFDVRALKPDRPSFLSVQRPNAWRSMIRTRPSAAWNGKFRAFMIPELLWCSENGFYIRCWFAISLKHILHWTCWQRWEAGFVLSITQNCAMSGWRWHAGHTMFWL